MTPAELKALDAAATQGPWQAEFEGFHVSDPSGDDAASCDYAPDGRLVVAARNALPALIRLWEAAADCDNAHRHVDVCETMHHLRGCSCGHEQLAAALRELREKL